MRWDWSHESNPVPDSPERSSYVTAFAAWTREHAGSHLPFLAVAGDEPVGMAWLAIVARPPGVDHFHRFVGDIQSVYVIPAWRGRGVGGLMMATIIAEAKARGMTNLSVRAGRRPRPFYRRLGFTHDDGVLDLNLRA